MESLVARWIHVSLPAAMFIKIIISQLGKKGVGFVGVVTALPHFSIALMMRNSLQSLSRLIYSTA
jgi:hypothetical protein